MDNKALTEQLLDFIGSRSRPYAEVIDAWRTSCPRLPIWEDALGDGLVELVPGERLADATVRLTSKGQAFRGKHREEPTRRLIST